MIAVCFIMTPVGFIFFVGLFFKSDDACERAYAGLLNWIHTSVEE